jgi:hypothetical protein
MKADTLQAMTDVDALNPLGLVWADLVGKYALVGLTIRDRRGKVLSQEQIHRRITHADPKRGLILQLEGVGADGTCALPPDLRSFKPAPPGEYRLRSTGEVVRDPDFVATWIVEQPDA